VRTAKHSKATWIRRRLYQRCNSTPTCITGTRSPRLRWTSRHSAAATLNSRMPGGYAHPGPLAAGRPEGKRKHRTRCGRDASGQVRANVLFWSGFGIYSGSQHKEEAWRFLRFYAGEEGAKIWKDWALPTVGSVAESSGMTKDPIEGVWFRELNYLAPRAFVFTPYWGETAESALRETMEKVILDPQADVGAALKQAARQAQTALDAKR